MSYTTFRYSKLNTRLVGDQVQVSFDIANTGKRDGDEVAQVYVQYPPTGTYMPIKQLRGYQRVTLAHGKRQTVNITIPRSELRYWDDKAGGFVTPTGTYRIMVGSSSQNIHLQSSITL